MNIRTPLAISAALVAASVAASAWAWPRLGSAPLAIHWSLDGQVDRYASPAAALSFGPAILVGMTLLFAALPRLMPRTAPLERSAPAYRAVWIGVIALVTAMHALVIAQALGAPAAPIRTLAAGGGLLLMLIGNFVPKMRRNFVMGVRTPWTLGDERVWDNTHRFAGPAIMAGGVLAVLASLTLAEPLIRPVLLACFLAPAAAAVAFSYVEARRLGAA